MEKRTERSFADGFEIRASGLTEQLGSIASIKKTKGILVITGRPGPERRGSLVSGQRAADALRVLGHDVELCDFQPISDISIDGFSVAFLATQGWYGEDGKL